MKIAAFLPNWIGDAVMVTPALRALREKFAEAEILAVCRPYLKELLEGLDLFDRQIDFNPHSNRRDQRSYRVARRLKYEQIDKAVLFTNSFRSAAIARYAGAKQRLGFARNFRKFLLTDTLTPKPRDLPHPVIDEYLRITGHLGCRTDSRKMELAVSQDDEIAFSDFWNDSLSNLVSWGYVCLSPGGAYGPAKHWPSFHFAQLAKRIATNLGRPVVVVSGPTERQRAERIIEMARHPHVVTTAKGPVGIGLTKAAIKNSELLVTTDSGPRHFAPPFGVPVITLFGPTHIEWSETFYEKAVHLQLDVDCGPCQKRICPLEHHRCMKELTVDQVFDAASAILSQAAEDSSKEVG